MKNVGGGRRALPAVEAAVHADGEDETWRVVNAAAVVAVVAAVVVAAVTAVF